MGSKILILSHPKLTKLVQEIIEELESLPEITIKDVEFGNVIEFLNQNLSTIGPNMIITSGAHLGILRKKKIQHNIPIIPIPITKFDLLQAVLFAQQYGKKIAAIYYKDDLHHIKDTLNPFEYNCDFYSYSSFEEAEEIIANLKRSGINVIIGTGVICSIAESYNIPSVFLHSKDSILQVLEHVTRLESAKMEIEQTALKWSKEFISHSLYPNIMIDDYNHIEYDDEKPRENNSNINEQHTPVESLLESFLHNQSLSSFINDENPFVKENPFHCDLFPYITFGVITYSCSKNEITTQFDCINKTNDLRIYFSCKDKQIHFITCSKQPLTGFYFKKKLSVNLLNITGGLSQSMHHDDLFSNNQMLTNKINGAYLARELAKLETTAESVIALDQTNPYVVFADIYHSNEDLPDIKFLTPLFGLQNTDKLLYTLRLFLDHGMSTTSVANHMSMSRQTIYKLIEKIESKLGILTDPEYRFLLSYELRLLDFTTAMQNMKTNHALPMNTISS